MAAGPDGVSVRFVGDRLGGNRAVRCEPALPTEPFVALRAVGPRKSGSHNSGSAASGEFVVTRGCTVAYYEVSVGPSGDAPAGGVGAEAAGDGVECIAVGLGSITKMCTCMCM